MANDLRSFDNVQEVIASATSNPSGMLRNGQSTGRDSEWAGSKSIQEALDLAANGWKEHIPAVKRLTAELEHHFDNAIVNTFDAVNDVFGSVVDMGKFLTGEPECMIDFTPVKLTKVGRVVSIHVNTTHSASIDTKLIIARGSAITALVDLIEKTGNVVEVISETCVKGFGGGKDVLSYRVTVKAASEAMDLPKVLFCLAHPSWLRRIVFALMERETSAIRSKYSVGAGYGVPVDCVQSVKDAIVLNRTVHGEAINVDPERWIKERLSDLGLMN